VAAAGRGPARRRALWWAAVLACAAVGLLLRTWNLDHDQRQHLHPDERHWSLTSSALAQAPPPAPHGTVAGPVLDWLDGQRSPANAYRGADTFVYGPATLAVSRGVAGWLHDGVEGGDQPAALVAGAVDTAGVPLIDEDGHARFDDAYEVDLVGRLLGALADAATVVVVGLIGRRLRDPWVGVAAAFLAAVSVLGIQHAHFLGSEPVLGLAAALAVLATLGLDRGPRAGPAARTGLVAGLAAGAALAAKLTAAPLVLVPLVACGWLAATRRRRADWIRLGAVVVGAGVAFRVLYPSAFDGLGLGLSDQFWADLRRTREVNALDLPPALQWAGRTPVLDALRQLVTFTVGPGTFAAAALGAALLVRRRAAVGRWPSAVVVAAWLVPLALVLRQSVTTGRYFVPMLPALHVCGGYGLVALARAARQREPRVARAAAAGAAAVVGLSLLWGVAFVAGVHGQEHTRVTASRWMAQNVEPGAVVSVEAWDDGLPLAVAPAEPTAYEYEQLDLFGVDTVDKVERLAEQLGRIDYVVESSPRVWGTVTRIPARYPSTIRFFEELDTGRLGFERVATFTSPPRLGPWQLDESGAEEAYSVYDHPEVRIWRRVRDVPPEGLLARLDPVAAATAVAVHPDHGSANGAMLHAGERAANARIGTFDDDFDTDGNPLVHALGWFALLELLGLATFVVLAPALRALPDAGLGMAKVVGLVVTGFAVFAAVTWAGVPLTRGVVVACGAAWVGLGAWCAHRRRALLAELWAERRRALVQAEVVAAAAFVALLLLRAANPDLWHLFRGGEKPFELAMLTSVLRTRTLPPYDAWYAGGTLNYYYGGYLLLSVPARILRTSPALTMNLALGAIGSMVGGAAYSAGCALAALRPGRRPDRRTGRSADRPAAPTGAIRRAGLVAAGFVLLLPNAAIVPSILGRIVGSERGELDWWGLSRTIPGSPAVTEFPLWSLLFGDVHPHVMDLPVLLAVVTSALAWNRSLVVAARWREPATLAVLTGLLAGAARAVNTWDLPLALLLVALAPAGATLAGAPWRRCGATALAALAVVFVAWAPYAWRTEVTDAGVEAASMHTPFTSWLAHFGFLALGTVVVLAAAAVRAPRRAALGAGAAAAAVVVLVVSRLAPERTTLAISAVLALGCAAVAWRARRTAAPVGSTGLAPSLLLALGWAMVAGIEQFSVVNDFDRMNTVFKGWYQAWLLLALGSAVALSALAAPPVRLLGRLRGQPPAARATGLAARAVLVGAVLMLTAFVQLAVPVRLGDRTSSGGLSLDGLAYLDSGLTVTAGAASFDPGEDRPLIAWLQGNVRGTPTVAEMPGEDYSWTGRVAVHTGLPSVIVWPYHQSQQRRSYEPSVYNRVADVSSLYESGDGRVITSVLQRYSVGYVVFGTTEAAAATPRSRRALLTAPCLTVVFRDGPSFVAAVDQPCLAGQPGGLPVAPR